MVRKSSYNHPVLLPSPACAGSRNRHVLTRTPSPACAVSRNGHVLTRTPQPPNIKISRIIISSTAPEVETRVVVPGADRLRVNATVSEVFHFLNTHVPGLDENWGLLTQLPNGEQCPVARPLEGFKGEHISQTVNQTGELMVQLHNQQVATRRAGRISGFATGTEVVPAKQPRSEPSASSCQILDSNQPNSSHEQPSSPHKKRENEANEANESRCCNEPVQESACEPEANPANKSGSTRAGRISGFATGTEVVPTKQPRSEPSASRWQILDSNQPNSSHEQPSSPHKKRETEANEANESSCCNEPVQESACEPEANPANESGSCDEPMQESDAISKPVAQFLNQQPPECIELSRQFYIDDEHRGASPSSEHMQNVPGQDEVDAIFTVAERAGLNHGLGVVNDAKIAGTTNVCWLNAAVGILQRIPSFVLIRPPQSHWLSTLIQLCKILAGPNPPTLFETVSLQVELRRRVLGDPQGQADFICQSLFNNGTHCAREFLECVYGALDIKWPGVRNFLSDVVYIKSWQDARCPQGHLKAAPLAEIGLLYELHIAEPADPSRVPSLQSSLVEETMERECPMGCGTIVHPLAYLQCGEYLVACVYRSAAEPDQARSRGVQVIHQVHVGGRDMNFLVAALHEHTHWTCVSRHPFSNALRVLNDTTSGDIQFNTVTELQGHLNNISNSAKLMLYEHNRTANARLEREGMLHPCKVSLRCLVCSLPPGDHRQWRYFQSGVGVAPHGAHVECLRQPAEEAGHWRCNQELCGPIPDAILHPRRRSKTDHGGSCRRRSQRLRKQATTSTGTTHSLQHKYAYTHSTYK